MNIWGRESQDEAGPLSSKVRSVAEEVNTWSGVAAWVECVLATVRVLTTISLVFSGMTETHDVVSKRDKEADVETHDDRRGH